MKKLFFLAVLTAIAFQLTAQDFGSHKIATDLQEEWSKSSVDEMFHIVILMRRQFDAQEMTKQTQHMGKPQKREHVVNELQRIAKEEQKAVLEELQQGQKGGVIKDIHSFWIFNGICCTATKDMVLAIAERPDVAFVAKDHIIHVADGESEEALDIDIPRATNQWNVTQVNAPAVWNMGYTGRGVIVAVIDTGVNYNHTDIRDNMWDGGDEFPNHGWDFINNDNNPMDDHGHGTHCAGTVSSYGTNNKQCGIAKNATIMALKTLGPEGGLKSLTWAAIQFAVSHGADVLSLSLGSNGTGGYWGDRLIMENVLHCGVVASVAAGNMGSKYEDGQLKYPVPYNVDSPGNCPSPWHHPDQTLDGGRSAAVTVGSTTSDDLRSPFSAFGPSTWTEGDGIGHYHDYPWVENDAHYIGLIKPDIVAPGSSIISLSYSSNSGYTTKDGTSMATPCVAGVMALMLEANPMLTPAEIDSIIETTAVPCEGQTSKNNYYGSGRIDALAAINYMTSISAPTNLVATVSGFDVSLSWSAASNVASYSVYRNGTIIAASVTGTTYLDENAPAGENIYYVRSNGSNHQTSLPSNLATVNIAATHTPVNLMATDIDTGNRTVELKWNRLYHTDLGNYYYDFGEEHTAAQRFPSNMLRPYAGMQIEHLHFSVKQAGITCTIRIYEGDDLTPGTLLHEGNYTSTEDRQTIDYVFANPITINPNKVLWVTMTTSGALLMDTSYEGTNGNDALYYRFPDYDFWDSYPYYAWSFILDLSDGEDYTYSLYRNGALVTAGITVPHITTPYSNGINQYQVTAVTEGYASSASNSIYVADGNDSLNSLSLGGNDYLYGLSGSTITISGTLVNTNPEHLILENGAQLINGSEGVKATVKKAIQPFTESTNDGWNLIASPVTESLKAEDIPGLLRNEYDLYAFDPSGTDSNGNAKEWRNYEADVFTDIEPKVGYLYANSDETTLSFVGTLAGTAAATELTLDAGTLFAGFNLIGNPYPCNAYIERSFYVLNYNADSDSTKFVLVDNDTPIAPCAAVLVQAQEEGESVTFSKTAPPTSSKIAVRLNHADQKGAKAIDQVRIMFQQQCQLAKYPQENSTSTIYIPQNGKKLAVANAEGLTELSINLRTAKNGSYTLSFETEKLDLNYLHLIDNMTGNDVDLLVTPRYTFEGKTTDYESRFRLVFATNCEDADGDDETFAYVSNGEIVIAGVGDACNTSLQVVDMTGRVIRCLDVARNVSTNGMTAGVYVLRLINGDDVKTQKIVIE